MKPFLGALLLASMAAFGNAMFAYGQKKAGASGHPILFIVATLLVSMVSALAMTPFLPKMEVVKFLQTNTKWVVISGVGFAITFFGFYYLFNRYGASFYTLYAVLSIITTSIVVGVLFFHEKLNLYYIFAILLALGTIFFFYLGSTRKI